MNSTKTLIHFEGIDHIDLAKDLIGKELYLPLTNYQNFLRVSIFYMI